MNIAEMRDKSKGFLARIPSGLLTFIVIVLAAFFGFGLGYLAGLDAGQGSGLSPTTSPFVDTEEDDRVVASKTGKKYYLEWCGAADRITSENKVWFDSPAAAEAAGYTPAANCAGL